MKLAILSNSGLSGRTLVARKLFGAAILSGTSPALLACFDIEKPDVPGWVEKNNHSAEEIYAPMPVFDVSRCNFCGACSACCSANAINFNRFVPSVTLIVSRCTSCRKCSKACGRDGISMRDKLAGMVYNYRLGEHQIHAGELDSKSESGIPVMKALLERIGEDATAICDFGPGAEAADVEGFSVMDLAVLIITPDSNWRSDIEVLLTLTGKYMVQAGVVINKAIPDAEVINEIKTFCTIASLPLIGIIPFDKKYMRSDEISFTDYMEDTGNVFTDIWNTIQIRTYNKSISV